MRGLLSHFSINLPVGHGKGLRFAATVLIAHGAVAHSQEASSKVGTTEERGSIRDTVTEKGLREQMEAAAKANAQKAPISKQTETARHVDRASPLSESLIVGSGRNFTSVPMGAILHLPPEYRSKLLGNPTGDYLNWQNFLKQNTSWLAAKEVTLKMASGQDRKLTDRVVREVSSESRAIVAVFNGNPISILEPEPPKKESATESSNTQSSRLNRNSSTTTKP